MDTEKNGKIQITCGPGLASFVCDEVRRLGYETETVHRTGVEIIGCLKDAMRLNLYLATAYNVLFLLKEFRCNGPKDLYDQVAAIAWEDIIPEKAYISVVNRIDTPSIENTMYASLKTKDAIVDRMNEKTGSRPDSGKERKGLVLHLYWRGQRAWLYLNTSGRKLSDRGYRKMPHTAPMRESLAAAVLTATEYDGQVPLINPMCGSGTLAIEAALIATGKAPGLLRSSYGFAHIKGFDKEFWQSLRADALKQSRKHTKSKPPKPIIASDIDPQAITAAKKNAQTAGVDHLIDFHTCHFADTPLGQEEGIIALNPEYGSRLGEIKALEKTYEQIGDFFKQKCAGYTGYIFTGNLKLAKKVGLRTSRRIEFFNADIECRLLKYELYKGTKKQR